MDDIERAIRKYRIRRTARMDARWEESEHPRDKDGKFASLSGNGGSAGKVTQKTREMAKRHGIEIDSRVRTAKQDSNYKFINPNFGKGKDYSLNCGNCCIAYELKRRGMDVEAAPRQWMNKKEFHALFNGFKWQPIKAKRKEAAKKEIEAEMLKMGDGARGIVFSEWDGRRTGHFFNFEVENDKVHFLDCQSGDDANSYFDSMKPSQLVFARTDSLEIRDSIFACVRGRKKNGFEKGSNRNSG